MKPTSIMIIAGEASGDTLAAELVVELRKQLISRDAIDTSDAQPVRTGLAPRFFGAGGPRMKAAGVELAFDLTQHSVIGLSDVLRNYLKFRRLFHQLLALAKDRRPDVIIGVDYGGFNLRFGEAIRRAARNERGIFNNWNPRLVQFVSPQVWASRAGRALVLERDYDLLLSIFPFEKDWYATHAPGLHVEFVGHPMLERFQGAIPAASNSGPPERDSTVLLLPGSRQSELKRHLPVMLEALLKIQKHAPDLVGQLVLPSDALAGLAKSLGTPASVPIQIGNLPQALQRARLAIASTGTVTMECAFFGVPTVTLYKTSWSTYQIAKRLVKVKSLTMPNLLAGEEVFPEFIQDAATADNISRAALDLLEDEQRRNAIARKLQAIIASLGTPGATRRAAVSIGGLLITEPHSAQ